MGSIDKGNFLLGLIQIKGLRENPINKTYICHFYFTLSRQILHNTSRFITVPNFPDELSLQEWM